MTQHPQLDLSVAYCTLRGAQPAYDPDFNTTVQWDVPLLDGYSWQEVPNRGRRNDSFLNLWNPGLWKLILKGKFDAVLCYLSYRCGSFWIAFSASRFSNTAFLFGTDASSMAPRSGLQWKQRAKDVFWPRLYSLADQIIVPSNPTRDLMLSLGLPADRVTLTPYSVDNDWWINHSATVDRHSVRAAWDVGPETCVILFCAKLQVWKRPLDLLKAFASAELSNAVLIFAGEGAQRHELENQVTQLGLNGRVRFLGFLNQSELPAVYKSSDLMVLPSEYEPFGVVVNEASCCGCPVLVSDHVGAARDLVIPVEPALVYPCGDVEALSVALRELCCDKQRLEQLGLTAQQRMAHWSGEDTVNGTVEAVAAAIRHKGRS
jgi:glycosyltransferase involved in cell wall biosynthesis